MAATFGLVCAIDADPTFGADNGPDPPAVPGLLLDSIPSIIASNLFTSSMMGLS